MIRCIATILLSTALAIAARAQAVPFVTIQPSAERLAAGGAHVATPDNYNLTESLLEVNVGKTLWQTRAINFNLTNLGARFKVTPDLTASLTVTSNSMAEITLYGDSGQVLGTAMPNELCAGIYVAYNPIRPLIINLTGKYIRSALTDTEEASSLAADIGVIWRFGKWTHYPFAVGIRVENLGKGIDYGYGSYPLPTTVRIGGYDLAPLAEGHALEIAADLGTMPAFETFLTSISAGYIFKKMIAVRGGAHISTKADIMPTYASVGIGFTSTIFDISAAYLTAFNTYSISARLKL